MTRSTRQLTLRCLSLLFAAGPFVAEIIAALSARSDLRLLYVALGSLFAVLIAASLAAGFRGGLSASRGARIRPRATRSGSHRVSGRRALGTCGRGGRDGDRALLDRQLRTALSCSARIGLDAVLSKCLT